MNVKHLPRTIIALTASLCFGSLAGAAHAAGLSALIQDASTNYPGVLEAQAQHEQAQMQTEKTKSGHWPVLGATTTKKVTGSDPTSSSFTGLTARVNVFSAGAISAQVERDKYREGYYSNKYDEMRENTATSVAELYLQALRARELLDVEQSNLARHQKIIGDLEVIVKNDQGRLYELVQARSRALQVRMRMVQYEKDMRLALSRLSRYTAAKPTLGDPFGKNWREFVDMQKMKANNPSIQAQVNEQKAVTADLDNLKKSRWPSVDLVGKWGKTQGYPGTTHSINVVLNWNFLDRGAYYSQQTAGKQLIAAQRKVDALEREFEERSNTAEANMSQSELQALAAQQQISSSEKVVELYELQFKIGRRSLLDVLNAYQELASVQATKATANNDYRLAVLTYLTANSALVHWAQGRQPFSPISTDIEQPAGITAVYKQPATTSTSGNKKQQVKR